jgi:hypothetical protein
VRFAEIRRFGERDFSDENGSCVAGFALAIIFMRGQKAASRLAGRIVQ